MRTVLFLLALCVPVLLVLFAGNYWEIRTPELLSGLFYGEQDSGDDLFPVHAPVRTGGDFIAVAHSEALMPAEDTDFIFFSWVWFKRYPKEGETIKFLAKLDGESPAQGGYSFGVTREKGVLRPVLSWRFDNGKAKNWVFAELALVPRQWTLLSFGVFDGKFVGVRSVAALPVGQEIEQPLFQEVFHGGHPIEINRSFPVNESDLLLGAKRNGAFRGKLGPFGVFRGEEFRERYQPVLQELARSPFVIPDEMDADEVVLFVPEIEKDISEPSLGIRIRGIGEFTKKQNRKEKGDGKRKN